MTPVIHAQEPQSNVYSASTQVAVATAGQE